MLSGYFRNSCPYTTITVVGSTGSKEVEAIIDTGFNGFLTLPQDIADSIGMEYTKAVSSSIVADGSTSPSLIYKGKMIYDSSRVDLLIDVQKHCKILLGTALLEELKLSLYIDVVAQRVIFDRTGWIVRNM